MDLNDINILVAERVMGLVPCGEWVFTPEEPMPMCLHSIDTCHSTNSNWVERYTSDMGAAWVVFEKMGFDTLHKFEGYGKVATAWIAGFEYYDLIYCKQWSDLNEDPDWENKGKFLSPDAPTPELAICLAALKNKGIVIGSEQGD